MFVVKRPTPAYMHALTFVWLTAAVTGMLCLVNYSTEPGSIKADVVRWPSESQVPRSANRFRLIVFSHPHCPCTKASLRQLQRVLPMAIAPVDCCVIFVAESLQWKVEDSKLWQRAKQIKGVDLVKSEDLSEVHAFGASVSGEAFLFAPQGELLYHGGLTGSRGHEGDCDGSRTIAAYLAGGQSDITERPVFGCPLLNRKSS